MKKVFFITLLLSFFNSAFIFGNPVAGNNAMPSGHGFSLSAHSSSTFQSLQLPLTEERWVKADKINELNRQVNTRMKLINHKLDKLIEEQIEASLN